MRRTLAALTLATALLAPATTLAQGNSTTMKVLPQAEIDVVKVLTAQERAWNEGDLRGFLSGYKQSAQTTFLSESIHHGSDELAARYRATYPNREAMGTLSFGDLDPHLLDDRFATVTGHFHLERPRKSGGNADGVFSLVFEKTDAGWKIILDHTS